MTDIFIEINKKEFDQLEKHRYWLPSYHYKNIDEAKDNEMGCIGTLRFILNFEKSFSDTYFNPKKEKKT